MLVLVPLFKEREESKDVVRDFLEEWRSNLLLSPGDDMVDGGVSFPYLSSVDGN